MRVLITGASGQIGRALLQHVPARVVVASRDRAALDIADAGAVAACIDEFRPNVVINAAAYTAVDKAESEAARAEIGNVMGPANLAHAIAAHPDTRLLHISTDFVFDGSQSMPYKPTDRPAPLGVYGRTKLAGERAVLETLGERGLVLRTAWVYGPRGRNFLLTMLGLMRTNGAVRVVSDQFGSPTAAASVAAGLWAAASRPAVAGVLHWTDAGTASWYEFAKSIAREARAAGLLQTDAVVTPVGTAEYPTAAKRPAYSVLDTRQTTAALGLEPVPWQHNLHQVIREIAVG